MFAFVHIPKTAGTTINWMLRSTFGLRHCDVEPWRGRWTDRPFMAADFHPIIKMHPRLKSIAGHRVMPWSDLESIRADVQYFTLIRHPLKRCASLYQFVVRTQGIQIDFETWVRSDWLRDQQTRMIAGVADVHAAKRIIKDKQIFVGCNEYFDESMLIFQRLYAPPLNIAYERRNVARNNKLAERLLTNSHSRELLKEANREDMKLYEYVHQIMFPTYRQHYGTSLQSELEDYMQSRSSLNRLNVNLNRFYRNLVYKPARMLYRRRVQR